MKRQELERYREQLRALSARVQRTTAGLEERVRTARGAELQEGRAVNLDDGRPAEWLGEPGHEGLNQTGSPNRVVGRTLGGAPDDVHATGTPGGATASGGLAGTNVGGGSPDTVA